MKVVAIAACTTNRVIGTGGAQGHIPWHLPRDQAHFRAHTAGQHLLLGRKTFIEMTSWLKPGHKAHILTRDPSFQHPAAHTISHTTRQAIQAARASGANTLIICGGASIYHAVLPHTDEMGLTLIHTTAQGQALFPDLPKSTWHLATTTTHKADSENQYPLEFRTYQRKELN